MFPINHAINNTNGVTKNQWLLRHVSPDPQQTNHRGIRLIKNCYQSFGINLLTRNQVTVNRGCFVAKSVRIETDRLVLRTVTMDDVEDVALAWKLDEGAIPFEEAKKNRRVDA